MQTGILPRPSSMKLSRVLRYGAASALTTAVSLVMLGVLLIWISPVWANLVSVGAGSGLSFELNRRWVWKLSSPSRKLSELLLFVATSFTFLLLSTLAVREVAGWLGPGGPRTVRAIVIEATTVAVFGVRWLLQFFLLDRVLFRAPSPIPGLMP